MFQRNSSPLTTITAIISLVVTQCARSSGISAANVSSLLQISWTNRDFSRQTMGVRCLGRVVFRKDKSSKRTANGPDMSRAILVHFFHPNDTGY
ncbi:hypothetical protein F4604DRAFT_861638 [Suillus subluteus]|nr:hypothetical protein F4604DRAFT_861638 [Suillus subluteus]